MATSDKPTFGTHLKELRLSRGLSQADLAAQIHIAPNSVARYENGLREPDLDTIKTIALFFGVDFNYLLCCPNELAQQNDLLTKFNSLDDRGKSTVLSVLDHEYALIHSK